ncbi:MAG: SDR family oxidoreductase, partial [Fidelibacterota bacterium]
MEVAVFGGTGFAGSYLVETLLQHDHAVRMLVRPGSEKKVHPSWKVEIIRGNLQDTGAVRETLADSQAVVYSVGVLRPPKRSDF